LQQCSNRRFHCGLISRSICDRTQPTSRLVMFNTLSTRSLARTTAPGLT
jgi:hypothetical protein